MRNWGRKVFVISSALVVLAGCKRTDDGRVVIQRPGDVDIKVKSDTLTLPKMDLPHVHVGSTEDTVNTPTLNVGTRKQVIKHPTIGITRH